MAETLAPELVHRLQEGTAARWQGDPLPGADRGQERPFLCPGQGVRQEGVPRPRAQGVGIGIVLVGGRAGAPAGLRGGPILRLAAGALTVTIQG